MARPFKAPDPSSNQYYSSSNSAVWPEEDLRDQRSISQDEAMLYRQQDGDWSKWPGHSRSVSRAWFNIDGDEFEMQRLEQRRERMRQGCVYFTRDGWWVDCAFYLRNHHVAVAPYCADPAHPFTARRRQVVLISSLAFATFVCTLFEAFSPDHCSLCPTDIRSENTAMPVEFFDALRHWPLTVATLLQLVWDVPGAMLGTCPCVQLQKPLWLRRVCSCALLTCTACHLVLWLLWAVAAMAFIVAIGALQSSHLGRLREILVAVAYTKILAFCLSAGLLVALFTVLRWRETSMVDKRRVSSSVDNSEYAYDFANSSRSSSSFQLAGYSPSPRTANELL
ncbi:hypothetical protein AB1Y20_017340 [Prymnesium parvum]|uniref:Protein S-acyltransferase n=1 Tax=Prymnesium parvum TaxID=97485 RepID=A0AB34JKZ8_PRYPA